MIQSIIYLKDSAITYPIANLIYIIQQLYSIMFNQIVQQNQSMNIYINAVKEITSRMVSKPLLFKYYMINVRDVFLHGWFLVYVWFVERVE